MAQPLQRKRRNGSQYTRPPDIENAIDAALLLDEARVTERATLKRGEPGYLKTECIVHLIRDAKRSANRTRMNRLVNVLFKRCAANLRSTVDDELPGAEELREEIMSQLVELFAVDGTPDDKLALDYYEIRFDSAFQKLRVNAIRAHIVQHQVEKSVEDLARLKNESDDDTHDRLATRECIDLIAKRLDILTEDERTAIALRYLEGLDVSSVDSDEPTVAKLTGVSDVTVRKRLRSAKQKLLAALEGKL